jgi:hypothetical protein
MQNNSAVNANGGAGNAAEKKAALFDEDFEKDYQKYNSQQIKNQENAQLLRKSMDDAAQVADEFNQHSSGGGQSRTSSLKQV